MENINISVVMAAYNEPIKMVKESIESIIYQTLKPSEIIIIVDNPKNIELIDFLNYYKQYVKVYVNEKNRGLAFSLNKGISLASSDLIARMDSDDISLPNRFENEYYFMKNGDYDLVSSNITYIDEFGNDLDIQHIAPSNDRELLVLLKHVNCMSHPTYMFTKKLFNSIDGYKEELKAAQDYEFVNNAIVKGFHIGFVPEILLKYRIRSGNISKNENVFQRFITDYTRKVYVGSKEYSKKYIEDCLIGNNDDYNEFERQYEMYKIILEEDSLVSKRIKQLIMCIKFRYIRSILYHDFAYRLLGRIYKLKSCYSIPTIKSGHVHS